MLFAVRLAMIPQHQMKPRSFALVLSCLTAANLNLSAVEVYQDATQPLEKRVEDLLSRLTLEEKISLLHARFQIHHRRDSASGHPAPLAG